MTAGEHYVLGILPILNSPESLEIIEELWDSPNDDVALSARCAAVVVAAFMITPQRRTPDRFIDPDVHFIWDDDASKQFLAHRLGVDTDAGDGGAPNYDPHSDNARLHNITHFLTDIKDRLGYMNTQWWTSDNAYSILREHQALSDARHTEEYRIGHSTFDQQGGRASPAFVPAAQQDLITLTLEILARDPVANVATSWGEAFRDAYRRFKEVAWEQAQEQVREQVRERVFSQAQQIPAVTGADTEGDTGVCVYTGAATIAYGVSAWAPVWAPMWALAWALKWAQERAQEQVLRVTLAQIRTRAAESLNMIEHALKPVLEIHLPDDDTSLSQTPVPQSVEVASMATAPPDDGPVPTHAGSAQNSLPWATPP
ncbi:hypothetical protein H4582DRAFT_2215160 [Lactarius indigo]|nr:hypothetical protein H4582DRAFT_2215160 [Lactarius indigo]